MVGKVIPSKVYGVSGFVSDWNKLVDLFDWLWNYEGEARWCLHGWIEEYKGYCACGHHRWRHQRLDQLPLLAGYCALDISGSDPDRCRDSIPGWREGQPVWGRNEGCGCSGFEWSRPLGPDPTILTVEQYAVRYLCGPASLARRTIHLVNIMMRNYQVDPQDLVFLEDIKTLGRWRLAQQPLVSARDAALVVGCPLRTVQRLAYEGSIRARRPGSVGPWVCDTPSVLAYLRKRNR